MHPDEKNHAVPLAETYAPDAVLQQSGRIHIAGSDKAVQPNLYLQTSAAVPE